MIQIEVLNLLYRCGSEKSCLGEVPRHKKKKKKKKKRVLNITDSTIFIVFDKDVEKLIGNTAKELVKGYQAIKRLSTGSVRSHAVLV
jgi:hypothetical protein